MYTKDQLLNFNYPADVAGLYAQMANLEGWTEQEVAFVATNLNKTIAAVGEDFAWLAFGLTSAIYDGKGGEVTASYLDPDHGVWPDTRPEIARARRFFDEMRRSGEEAKLDALGVDFLPSTFAERRLQRAAARRRPLKD